MEYPSHTTSANGRPIYDGNTLAIVERVRQAGGDSPSVFDIGFRAGSDKVLKIFSAAPFTVFDPDQFTSIDQLDQLFVSTPQEDGQHLVLYTAPDTFVDQLMDRLEYGALMFSNAAEGIVLRELQAEWQKALAAEGADSEKAKVAKGLFHWLRDYIIYAPSAFITNELTK